MDRRQVAFELLNEELAKEGLNLALICVGVLFWSNMASEPLKT